jgi:hypothetical protein
VSRIRLATSQTISGVGVRICVRTSCFFSSPYHSDRFCWPSSLLFNGYREFLPGEKAAGVWSSNSLATSAKAKITRVYTSTPHKFVQRSSQLHKHKVNVTLLSCLVFGAQKSQWIPRRSTAQRPRFYFRQGEKTLLWCYSPWRPDPVSYTADSEGSFPGHEASGTWSWPLFST